VRRGGVALVGHPTSCATTMFRRPTPGPENDMLLEYVQRALPLPGRGEELAVFLEPHLDTGCPDAVAVYWRPRRADARALGTLRPRDDRLLHLIWLEGVVDAGSLEGRFGPAVSRRAQELAALGVIRSRGGELSVPRSRLALSRLIAIEAKLSSPASALAQATRNSSYASESYVLMPNPPTVRLLCSKYSACGVGIVTPQVPLTSPVLPARHFGLPISPLTWRFNRMALAFSERGRA
jgi:hypothetical protein